MCDKLDSNKLELGQLASLTASGSGDRSNEKLGQKALRRLAQNCEAARKSRLRKKAYVEQLENSRLKLAQHKGEEEAAGRRKKEKGGEEEGRRKEKGGGEDVRQIGQQQGWEILAQLLVPPPPPPHRRVYSGGFGCVAVRTTDCVWQSPVK